MKDNQTLVPFLRCMTESHASTAALCGFSIDDARDRYKRVLVAAFRGHRNATPTMWNVREHTEAVAKDILAMLAETAK